MAKRIAKLLRDERPDYYYLKNVFKELRNELNVQVPKKGQRKLPYVPSDKEMQQYYEAVWKSENYQDMTIIKLFLYTGIRVSELVDIELSDVDLDLCQIRINDGKGSKDRIVPFPKKYKELLSMHMDQMKKKGARYLFESSWKNQYTDRGIRKILEKYSKRAGMEKNVHPHQLRHYVLTWLKRQKIDDAFIQPYSGHKTRKSLEVYSTLSIAEAQEEYDKVIDKFPV